MRIGLICGGPSAERGISLNSARSVTEHLTSLGCEVIPFYCDFQKKFYFLPNKLLYSNTPSDFEYILTKKKSLSEKRLLKNLRNLDIVFPVIHGEYGEDGELQKLLEKNDIPFIGSTSEYCNLMFDKVKAKKHMKIMADRNFGILDYECIYETDDEETREEKIKNFFDIYIVKNIYGNNDESKDIHDNFKVVVKPATNGSSIGVEAAGTPQEAMILVEDIFAKKLSNRALIEPYCKGSEFTVIVLQNENNEPVALIPTEKNSQDKLLTYRNKYLPSCQVEYCCPPTYSSEIIGQIQKAAENLFLHFKMRDFARLDGWLINEPNNRELIFSDFNPISGMEQDSDMFIQGSRIGFSHRDILEYIVNHAAKRYRIKSLVKSKTENSEPQKIHILFGGNTSERQVSMMSGRNVWLKMLYEPGYLPLPYILGPDNKVCKLPYSFMLNYSIESMLEYTDKINKNKGTIETFASSICERLKISDKYKNDLRELHFMSLNEFYDEAVKENAFIFIALHGGKGENGWLQEKLNHYKLAYNGSDVKASSFCMNKYKTGKILSKINEPLLTSLPKIQIPSKVDSVDEVWKCVVSKLRTSDIIIKPQADGSSAGIVRLKSSEDLKKYLEAIAKAAEAGKILDNSQDDLSKYLRTLKLELKKGNTIFTVNANKILDNSLNYENKQALENGKTTPESGTLCNQKRVELPTHVDSLILEPFIMTDEILKAKEVGSNIIRPGIPGPFIVHIFKTGWIELTVGVLEENGIYHALSPSITVAEENVLSLEEKFQGGTGVNLTPPPEEIITSEQIILIKDKIEKAAKALDIQGYARIDIFFNTKTNETVVIEANTLPGLTPSTVIFHQALAEVPSLTPQEFLSKLIKIGIKSLRSDIEWNTIQQADELDCY